MAERDDAPPAHLRDLIPAGWRLTIEYRRPTPELPWPLEWHYTIIAPCDDRSCKLEQSHSDDLRRDCFGGPVAFERAVIERLVARMRGELARVGGEGG